MYTEIYSNGRYQGNFLMEKDMEKELIIGKKEINMREIGKMAKQMEKELIIGQMEINMKESGKMM